MISVETLFADVDEKERAVLSRVKSIVGHLERSILGRGKNTRDLMHLSCYNRCGSFNPLSLFLTAVPLALAAS